MTIICPVNELRSTETPVFSTEASPVLPHNIPALILCNEHLKLLFWNIIATHSKSALPALLLHRRDELVWWIYWSLLWQSPICPGVTSGQTELLMGQRRASLRLSPHSSRKKHRPHLLSETPAALKNTLWVFSILCREIKRITSDGI